MKISTTLVVDEKYKTSVVENLENIYYHKNLEKISNHKKFGKD